MLNDIVTIRPATASDGERLASIEQACFSQPHWGPEAFADYQTTVALSDGKPVGFLVSRELFDGEREILSLAVLPEWRRQGVAKALLQSELEKQGMIFLEVRESNVGAQTLYRSFGFEQIGIRREYYVFPNETAIVMRLK